MLSAIMASGRRTATVTSSSPMRLVSVFKTDLWKLADERPAFGAALRDDEYVKVKCTHTAIGKIVG